MNEFGYSFEKQNTLFYFGNKKLTEALLKEHFPHFIFKRNKQIHSNTVIDARQSPQEADGLWTMQANTALIAVSADCVPILLSNGRKIFALHAGWRGVASDIVGSAFETLSNDDRHSKWLAYVGPHIQRSSFEIQSDTLQPLTAAWNKVCSQEVPAERIRIGSGGEHTDQWLFDLNSLVSAQLRFYFRDTIDIFNLNFDTKQNPLFNSYRRDKEKAGRNFSFVVLKGT